MNNTALETQEKNEKGFANDDDDESFSATTNNDSSPRVRVYFPFVNSEDEKERSERGVERRKQRKVETTSRLCVFVLVRCFGEISLIFIGSF